MRDFRLLVGPELANHFLKDAIGVRHATMVTEISA